MTHSPEFRCLLGTADSNVVAYAVIGYIEATCKSPLLKPKEKVKAILDVIAALDSERLRLDTLIEEGHRRSDEQAAE